MRWAIGVNGPTRVCGRPSHQSIVRGHCFTDALVACAAVIPEEHRPADRKREGRDCPCGALEEYAAPTPGSFCPRDALFFQVVADA